MTQVVRLQHRVADQAGLMASSTLCLVAATYDFSRMRTVVDVGADAEGCYPRSSSGTRTCVASSSTSLTSSRTLGSSGLRLAQTISLGRLEEAMGHHLIEAQPV
jgi:hypothetical protein